jgi:hypothetical protein
MEDNLHKELADLSPLLNELHQQKETFEIPEGYFEQMQLTVLAKMQAEKPSIASPKAVAQKVSEPSIWQTFVAYSAALLSPKYALAMASVILMTIVSWHLYRTDKLTADTCNDLACVSDIEIEQYVEENIDDFEAEQIWTSATTVVVNATDLPDSEQLNSNSVPSKPPHIKEANDLELDKMIEELIQEGKINEEDLENVL